MRSTGDRRKDEVRALQELNVKRRKKAGKPTKAKKVDATVDGRGAYGQKSGYDRYKTGFGSWRRTTKEKDKNSKTAFLDKKEKQFRDSKKKGIFKGWGASKPRESQVQAFRDEWEKEWEIENRDRKRNPSDAGLRLIMGQPQVGNDMDETQLAINLGMLALPSALALRGSKGLKAAKDGSRVGKADRSAGNSSFKEWSKKNPPKSRKKPAPARRAADAEDMPDLGPIDPRQPRPYAMGMLRPLEPDYLQGFHHMNVAAPSWYTPFRVFRGPKGGY